MVAQFLVINSVSIGDLSTWIDMVAHNAIEKLVQTASNFIQSLISSRY